MENNDIRGELKIYIYVTRIAEHASDTFLKPRGRRVLLQSIPCFYSKRKETLARFREANPQLVRSPDDLWVEFKFVELV